MKIEDLVRECCRAPLLSASEREGGPRLDADAVAALLPHRGSSLFIDRITRVLRVSPEGAIDGEPWGTIVGRLDLDRRAPLFDGHFPGNPLWPGVLQFEAIGQAGTCLFRLLERNGVAANGLAGSAAEQMAGSAAEDMTGGTAEAMARRAPATTCVLTDILAGRCLRTVVPEGEAEIVARVYRDGLFIIVIGQCLKDGAVCSAAALRGIELEVA